MRRMRHIKKFTLDLFSNLLSIRFMKQAEQLQVNLLSSTTAHAKRVRKNSASHTHDCSAAFRSVVTNKRSRQSSCCLSHC